MINFVDDPKRVRPPTERVSYLYDLREIILEEFNRLNQTPGCEMPGSGEAVWF
jgi:hypothetical protein